MPDQAPAFQLAVYTEALWPAGAMVEIRPLPPESGKRRWIRAADLEGLADELAAENRAGANLFAGILPRLWHGRGSDADAGPGWAVWADFDDSTEGAVRDVLAITSMPEPTMLVNSGHGVHAFWGLQSEASPADLSALVGDMAVLLGSDPTVRNPSRILRLPGFTNHKPPAAMAGVIAASPALRYTFAELRALVPQPEPEPAETLSSPAIVVPDRKALVERAAKYAAKMDGAGEGGRNAAAFRVAAALVKDFGLAESEALPILGEWNSRQCSPPLPAAEVGKVLGDALRYGKRPAGEKANRPAPAPPALPKAEPRDGGIPLPAAADSALADEFAAEARGERMSVPLPWPWTSRALGGGLRPGTLLIIGGPPGHGKSLMLLDIATSLEKQGVMWMLLPLEDNRAAWERRALAQLAENWAVLDDSPGNAAWREERRREHAATLGVLSEHVAENPRQARGGDVPALPYQSVVDWVRRAVDRSRVVMVDPLAAIDFGDFQQWSAEQAFVRQLVGIAAGSGSTVVLVVHTSKRPGKSAAVPLSSEDLQGSTAISRLAHSVLMLEPHEWRESMVEPWQGMRRPAGHDRCVVVAKARNGPGHGHRFAFAVKPGSLAELGCIVKKGDESGRPSWYDGDGTPAGGDPVGGLDTGRDPEPAANQSDDAAPGGEGVLFPADEPPLGLGDEAAGDAGGDEAPARDTEGVTVGEARAMTNAALSPPDERDADQDSIPF